MKLFPSSDLRTAIDLGAVVYWLHFSWARAIIIILVYAQCEQKKAKRDDEEKSLEQRPVVVHQRPGMTWPVSAYEPMAAITPSMAIRPLRVSFLSLNMVLEVRT